MDSKNSKYLLDRIKSDIKAGDSLNEAGSPAETDLKPQTTGKTEVAKAPDIDNILAEGGFPLLYKTLEGIRTDFTFDRRIVYTDEESAEVLDLLRKEAKIKSNLLVSYLLHQFFEQHKGLIQELIKKRDNRFLE